MSAWLANSLEEVTPRQRSIITFAVVACTVVQLLDTTIINVALPHMKGQLGASPEQISWVLTSYVVAASIFMPLTGFFSDRLGIRWFLLISIAGFTLTSLLCGLSSTISEIVVFRLLQGVFGAALVPLSQMILMRVYPVAEHGKAMALWGMGIMVGPVMGPSLGGWLTERWSWHWTFFINVPLGIMLLGLVWAVMPNSESRLRRMDWTGFALMALAIASMQLVLDMGQRQDWFSSNMIRSLVVLGVVSFAGFIWHGLSGKDDPIFDLRMFLDRNFTVSVFINGVMAVGFYGTALLLPLMMVEALGFNILITGLVLAPRGVVTIFSSILAGRLLKIMDSRKVLAMGIIFVAAGVYPMTFYNPDTSFVWIIIPSMIQGLGLGMLFVTLSTMVFATLPAKFAGEAAGVYNLTRSLGGSIGIAIVAAFFARHAQMAWGQLRGGVSESSAVLQDWIQSSGLDASQLETWRLLALQLEKQGQMVAYVDGFKLIFVVFISLLPMICLFKLKPEMGVDNKKSVSESASQEVATT